MTMKSPFQFLVFTFCALSLVSCQENENVDAHKQEVAALKSKLESAEARVAELENEIAGRSGGTSPIPTKEIKMGKVIESQEEMEAELNRLLKDFPDNGDWGDLDIEEFNSAANRLTLKVICTYTKSYTAEGGIFVEVDATLPFDSVTVKGRELEVDFFCYDLFFSMASKGSISKLRKGDRFTTSHNSLFLLTRSKVENVTRGVGGVERLDKNWGLTQLPDGTD